MYKAIKTKYHGPGNVKGSRVSAADGDSNKITLSWDHSLSGEENHVKAAYALCEKMGWKGELASGHLRDCYVHVFVNMERTHAK